jgi:hypothetical protein
MQGFFNFVVFIWPRYRNSRQNNPDRYRRWSIHQAVWNPIHSEEISRDSEANSRSSRDSGQRHASDPRAASEKMEQIQPREVNQHSGSNEFEKDQDSDNNNMDPMKPIADLNDSGSPPISESNPVRDEKCDGSRFSETDVSNHQRLENGDETKAVGVGLPPSNQRGKEDSH